jgi:uncharacterized protein (DUF342 family)
LKEGEFSSRFVMKIMFIIMDDQKTTSDTPKPFDATVKVYVTPDILEARIYLEPPENGGVDATPQMIDDAIKLANVVYGIDAELIGQLKNRPVYSQELVMARGLKPVDGTDGSISYNFKLVTDPHPKLRENGTVDYRDLGIIENADKGKVLCNITLPTKGTEGISVVGKKLLQISGKAVNSPLGRNTKLSEDQTKVIATVDGNVTLINSKVSVSETFVVNENVDNSTGNIVFVGNVQIFGNVLENFSVNARGNVDIYGTIEGGIVKSGKNINAHGGIVGMSHSVIECKGNLVSTFLENCTIEADGSITAESIMNCTIKCDQSLELVGIRAKLIGGRCLVGKDIIANVIGSPANLLTELILGADPATMIRHATLLNELEQMTIQSSKLNQIITLLTQYEAAGRLPQDKVDVLESSKLSLNVNSTKLKIKQKELELIKQKIENAGKGKVVCRSIMHRGVRLTIGFTHKNIEEPFTYSTFTSNECEILVTSAS